MPMPFERLRVLNGTTKDVKSIKYRGSKSAGVQPSAGLLPAQTVPDTDTGQAQEGVPVSLEYTDLKTLAITSLTIGTIHMPLWEIYYADEYGMSENVILAADLYIQDHPDGGNKYYMVARISFADGSIVDYPSPLIS